MPRILHRHESLGIRRNFKYLGHHYPNSTSSGSTDSNSSWSQTEDASPQDSYCASQRREARADDATLFSSSSSRLASSSCSDLMQLQQQDFNSSDRPNSSLSMMSNNDVPKENDEWGFYVDFSEPVVDERHFLTDFTGQARSSSRLFSITEK